MSTVVRQHLSNLVRARGLGVCDEPRQCEALLNDLCRDDYKREIFVLVNAARLHIPNDLCRISTTDIPRDVLLARLTDRLTRNLGLSHHVARWGVETWAIALGIVGAAECASADEGAENTDNPFELVSLDATEMLRDAVRKVLADDVVTDDERVELQTLRRTLGIPPEVAGHIFAEERNRKQQEETRSNIDKSRQSLGLGVSAIDKGRPWLGFGVAAMFLAIVGGVLFSTYGPLSNNSARAEMVEVYAIRQAIVRSAPTTSSPEVGRVQRAERVQGIWVTGLDNSSRWLKIASGTFANYFVGAVNLSAVHPPVAVRIVDQDMSIRQLSEVRQVPDPSAPVLETLKPRASVHVAVQLESGWMEILRRAGGVGYLSPNAFQAPVQ